MVSAVCIGGFLVTGTIRVLQGLEMGCKPTWVMVSGVVGGGRWLHAVGVCLFNPFKYICLPIYVACCWMLGHGCVGAMTLRYTRYTHRGIWQGESGWVCRTAAIRVSRRTALVSSNWILVVSLCSCSAAHHRFWGPWQNQALHFLVCLFVLFLKTNETNLSSETESGEFCRGYAVEAQNLKKCEQLKAWLN